MLVTDRAACRGNLIPTVRAALRGGVTAVMLREKDLTIDQLDPLALELREATRTAGALLILNHHVQMARIIEADGVHLGWRSVSIREARRQLGPETLIGISTHSLQEARHAEESGANYVTFGPIFPTPAKQGLVETQGLDALRPVCQTLSIPVLALGGIDETNATSVLEAGADGLAAIRALLTAENTEETARNLSRAVSDRF